MANKIQLRRGVKANLPALDVGEPAFTTDTKELYIGASGGNKKIGDTADKLATARNIAVTGAVTGNANFDGSANISISTTLQALSAALVTSGAMSPARIQQDASNRFATDTEKSTWNAKQSAY